ncbi:MarR family winged helix-turn-helix transcriptional regulator [Actinoplanes sp. NBC_00393]|uniref:MarR family winged helix-turn-helix transcriptional regulator n=1 Tax=Actinoplanes sp. NBC_00393 TaxID=2975953 RepID=UPI002E1E3656
MTDELRDRNTGEADQAEPANSNFAVLAAIAELGLDATPAAIAKKVGIAYSTVNPKLRAWENAGLAERFRHDTGQTLWRLTDAGRASTATPPQFADTVPPAETALADPTADGAIEPAMQAGSGPAAAAPPLVTSDSSEITDGGDDDETATSPAAPAPADGDTTSSATADSDTDRNGANSRTTATAPPAKRKRPKGALQASALAILQANSGSEYKVDELRKLIDEADAGTGYPRASHGAVANALDSLERDGKAVKVEDRKAATFTLASTAD